MCSVRKYVAHVDRNAAARRDYNFFHLLGTFDSSRCTHKVTLALVLDVSRTGGDVVALNGINDVCERQSVGDQLHWIGLHVVLLHVSADCFYTCNILYTL